MATFRVVKVYQRADKNKAENIMVVTRFCLLPNERIKEIKKEMVISQQIKQHGFVSLTTRNILRVQKQTLRTSFSSSIHK